MTPASAAPVCPIPACAPPAPAVTPAPAATASAAVQTPTTTLVALIAHARGVPSAAREAFGAECAALADDEAVILVHTCHRVELYVAMGAFGDRELPQLPAQGLRLEDAAAARHLISVACGLQSAVLGEDQVLHQVRETYALRRGAGPVDPVLDRLFQVALNAGRRAHGWFAGTRRSLGDAALDNIEHRVGTLEDQPILIVGTGSMGRLTAQATIRRGVRPILTNRTEERAAVLARDVKGQSVP